MPNLRFSFTVLIAKCGLKEAFQEDGRKMGKRDVGDVAALGVTDTVDLVKSILLLTLKSRIISAPVSEEKRENCRPPAAAWHKVSTVLLSIYRSS